MKKKLSFLLSLIMALNLAVLTAAFPANAATSAPSIDDYEPWQGKTDKEVLEIVDKEITRWEKNVATGKKYEEVGIYRININDKVQYHKEGIYASRFGLAQDGGQLEKWKFIKEGMKKQGISRSELVAEGDITRYKFAIEKINAAIKELADRTGYFNDDFLKNHSNPDEFGYYWVNIRTRIVNEVLETAPEKEAVEFAKKQVEFLKGLKDNVKQYDIQGEIKRMEDFIRNPKELRKIG